MIDQNMPGNLIRLTAIFIHADLIAVHPIRDGADPQAGEQGRQISESHLLITGRLHAMFGHDLRLLFSWERIGAEGSALQGTEKAFKALLFSGAVFPAGLEGGGANILKRINPPTLPWKQKSKVVFGKIKGKHAVYMDIAVKTSVLERLKLPLGDGFQLPELFLEEVCAGPGRLADCCPKKASHV